MTIIHRLSPYNIANTIRRAELYRAVREGAADTGNDWTVHVVQPDEDLRPELIAYRVYGTVETKWVVQVVSGLDETRNRIEPGTTLRFPPTVWLRRKIRALKEAEAA